MKNYTYQCKKVSENELLTLKNELLTLRNVLLEVISKSNAIEKSN